jgi:hypothetical protein
MESRTRSECEVVIKTMTEADEEGETEADEEGEITWTSSKMLVCETEADEEGEIGRQAQISVATTQ